MPGHIDEHRDRNESVKMVRDNRDGAPQDSSDTEGGNRGRNPTTKYQTITIQ